jgi:hypothetical protein
MVFAKEMKKNQFGHKAAVISAFSTLKNLIFSVSKNPREIENIYPHF